MKIAIISDIHSNLEALKATLQNIKKRNVDMIICLGDIIAKGVHPRECIELIRANCDVVLQGNCDRHFSATHDLSSFPKQEQTRIKWNQSMLSEADKAYLSSLPFSYEFYLSGSLIRLFHAHPKADNITVLNLDSIDKKLELFQPTEKTSSQNIADIVIYGHIHHPYLDRLYNKTIINIGSVGNSFDTIRNPSKDSNNLETTRSNYLLLEGEFDSKEYTEDISFQFIRVPYDIEKELEDGELNIEKDDYRFELTEGRYRDMTKINQNFEKIGVNVSDI